MDNNYNPNETHEPEVIGVTTEGEPLYDKHKYKILNSVWYE